MYESIRSSLKDIIIRAHRVHNNFYCYDEYMYVNAETKSIIICPNHGKFEQTMGHHINRKDGCPKCRLEKLSKRFSSNINDFKLKANSKHNNLYSYENFVYINAHQKGLITCRLHGDFSQSPNNHLKGKGCPYCKTSKGENIIKTFLKENNINFIPQKKFDGCVHKKKLPFDFYLPSYNLCIEYQGEQHYKPIKNWGGVNQLCIIQTRDSIKRQFCNLNNIKLLEISYVEDILKVLKDFCAKNNLIC